MVQFDSIKGYNRKYTGELDNAIRIIMPKLIQAFVNIFEGHKDYISFTLTNLNFVYFIPEYYLFHPLAMPKNSPLYKVGNEYQKYNEYLRQKLKSIPEPQKEDFILKHYCPKSDLKSHYENAQITQFLEEDSALFTNVLEYDSNKVLKHKKVVLLSIFVIDLKTIIHELTHALLISVLCLTEDRLIVSHGFPNTETMELISDFIATKVLEEYIRIGGVIPESLSRFKLPQKYEDKSYLVEYFYNSLYPLILESLISGNHNMLEKSLGVSAFNQYCDRVKHLYYKQSICDFELAELENIVDKMLDNYFKIKKENYESFYQELESMGYRVRRLK